MLVSAIIPVFNREDTIEESVASALNQTHREIEVIVVDDGSTDRTVERLKRMRQLITLITQDNAGPSAARNRGVAVANGEIVAFLDSDDSWAPEKIERQVRLMERAGRETSCCVCNANVTGVDGTTIGRTFDFAGLHVGFDEGVWTNPQEVLSTRFLLFNQVVAVRRDVFRRLGGYDESLRLLEDYELAVRLSAVGSWGIIREPLVTKRNDTRGIGVACMTQRDQHLRVRAEVIGNILMNHRDVRTAARGNLERQLADLELEAKAIAMDDRGGITLRCCARWIELQLRLQRAIRRRSPGWPAFQGHPLTSDHAA